MNWGTYGLLIAFALFILILLLNPRLSCFGKRIRSPFYPLLRKKEKKDQVKTEDYGFHLVEGEPPRPGSKPQEKKGEEKKAGERKGTDKKTDDYGFKLD
jgi:hypothetical protein